MYAGESSSLDEDDDDELPTPLSAGDYKSDFLAEHGIVDIEAAIRREKDLTHEKITRLGESVERDDRFYKEVLLRAKREYTGQQLKAVYSDSKNGQFFNVENLALTYYGKRQGWNGLHVENQLMKHLFGIFMWSEIFYDKVPYVF